jgi:hypothetical protein
MALESLLNYENVMVTGIGVRKKVSPYRIAQQQTSEKMDRTDEQMKRTDEKLERIGIHLGNVTRNQGDVAEDFFYQSLVKDNHLGGIRFDDITKNMQKHRGDIQEEYDLFMTNGDAIAVVEVKYKAHENDIDKLDRKMDNFKKLFPIYKNYKRRYARLPRYSPDDQSRDSVPKRGPNQDIRLG